MREYQNFVGGDFVATNRRFDDVDPATSQTIATVHEADADLVDRAVSAGRKALAGPWGAMGPDDRALVLDRIADGIDARFGDFVAAEVADTGRPIGVAETLDIPRGAANFRT